MAFAPFSKPKQKDEFEEVNTRGLLCAVESCSLAGGMQSGQSWYCRHHFSNPSLFNEVISRAINRNRWLAECFDQLRAPEKFFEGDGKTAEIDIARVHIDELINKRGDEVAQALSEVHKANTRAFAFSLIREFDHRVMSEVSKEVKSNEQFRRVSASMRGQVVSKDETPDWESLVN